MRFSSISDLKLETVYQLFLVRKRGKCGMYSPEIALHKKSNVMEEIRNEYVKRSQKDYSIKLRTKSCVVLIFIQLNKYKNII